MARNKSRKILVVDDNVDLSEIVADFLRYEGYEVIVAHDGRIALSQVDKAKPDVILSDIRMPEMDGLSMRRALLSRPETQHIPIIFLTGVPAEAAGTGVEPLQKPVAFDELLKKLAEVI